jgi:hypothetical protein
MSFWTSLKAFFVKAEPVVAEAVQVAKSPVGQAVISRVAPGPTAVANVAEGVQVADAIVQGLEILNK